MSDIIWGNGSKIILKNSFELSITHRKEGNSESDIGHVFWNSK